MKVTDKAATSPEPKIAIALLSSMLEVFKSNFSIFFAKCVVIQKVNITVAALATALSIFTAMATSFVPGSANKVKTLPNIKNKGAPGGCTT